MVYSIIYRHGFAICSNYNKVVAALDGIEATEIKGWPDLASAYVYACRRGVLRRLENHETTLPIFPRLQDIRVDVLYFEPGYTRKESVPYARYFACMTPNEGGVFTTVGNVGEFLREFPAGIVREFSDETAARIWTKNELLRFFYPASAYYRAAYFPVPSIYALDVLYDFGLNKWVSKNLMNDSPFPKLPRGDNHDAQ